MVGPLNKGTTVYSNDPKNQQIMLAISGTVKPYIMVTPQETINLNGFVGEKVETEITITSLLPQPLTISSIKSDIDDKIKYKLVTRQKGKEYVLRIKRRSKTEPYFRGQIVMTTDSMKKPKITLGLLSRLQQEVAVKPESLVFGTIDTSAEYFAGVKLSKTVTLRDRRGSGLVITEIIPSCDWIAAANEKTKTGYTIAITLDKTRLPRGNFEESVEVRTNDKKKSIRIPITGKVL
jgi:hypothetical protein